MAKKRWEIIGVCVAASGLGVGALPWLLDKLKMNPPHWLLFVGFLTAVILFLGGLVLAGAIALWPNRENQKGQRRSHASSNPTTAIKEATMTQESKGNVTQNIYSGNYGVVIGQLTIEGASKPKVTLSNQTETQLADGTYRYTSMLDVQTTYVLPQLKVIARAPSIASLEVIPQRSGTSMSGHSSKRDGFVFATLQNVAGTYQIRVVTTRQEQVIVDLEG